MHGLLHASKSFGRERHLPSTALLFMQLGCAVAVLVITWTRLQTLVPYVWQAQPSSASSVCLLSKNTSPAWCWYATAVAALSIAIAVFTALAQVKTRRRAGASSRSRPR